VPEHPWNQQRLGRDGDCSDREQVRRACRDPEKQRRKRQKQGLSDEELERREDLPGCDDPDGGQQKASARQRIKGEDYGKGRAVHQAKP